MYNKDAHRPGIASTRREMTTTEVDAFVQGGERACASYQYWTLFKGSGLKHTIRAKKFEDFVKSNIVEKSVCNNSQCFLSVSAKTEHFTWKNSFLWEQLKTGINFVICSELWFCGNLSDYFNQKRLNCILPHWIKASNGVFNILQRYSYTLPGALYVLALYNTIHF